MKIQILSALCVLTVIAGCDNKYPIDPLPKDTNPPSLTFPIASFATVNRFNTFGETLFSGDVNKGFTFFFTSSNQQVVAACGGTVTAITGNADGSSNIFAQLKANSIYTVCYEGVANPVVQQNTNLNPGTILGTVSASNKVTLKVIRNQEVCCPSDFTSPGFNTALGLAIANHNASNPTDTIVQLCTESVLPQ